MSMISERDDENLGECSVCGLPLSLSTVDAFSGWVICSNPDCGVEFGGMNQDEESDEE